MLLKVIDKLLDRSFQKKPDYARLDQLESDVWEQIRHSKSSKNKISFMIPVWSNTQLRYASLTVALIGGLAVSQLSSIQPTMPVANTLGLEVFSPNAPFLITSTLEQSNLISS